MKVKNDLFDYENRFIYQDDQYFKFSLDSILLAEYVEGIKKSDIIVDMCAGNMSVPLILSKYYSNKITGFEIQKAIWELGKESIEINNLTDSLEIINDDINNIDSYFQKESIDVFVCNPPYFKVNETNYINKCEQLVIARHEVKLNLDQIFNIASKYLKNKGKLYLVQRASRLDEILVIANKYNVSAKEIQLICTKKDDKPYLVLIKCVKNSRFGVKINNEICVEGLKTYKNIFKEK